MVFMLRVLGGVLRGRKVRVVMLHSCSIYGSCLAVVPPRCSKDHVAGQPPMFVTYLVDGFAPPPHQDPIVGDVESVVRRGAVAQHVRATPSVRGAQSSAGRSRGTTPGGGAHAAGKVPKSLVLWPSIRAHVFNKLSWSCVFL